jgi:hypothetical protein
MRTAAQARYSRSNRPARSARCVKHDDAQAELLDSNGVTGSRITSVVVGVRAKMGCA